MSSPILTSTEPLYEMDFLGSRCSDVGSGQSLFSREPSANPLPNPSKLQEPKSSGVDFDRGFSSRFSPADLFHAFPS